MGVGRGRHEVHLSVGIGHLKGVTLVLNISKAGLCKEAKYGLVEEDFYSFPEILCNGL